MFQDEGIKEKSKKTNLEKYGTEYPGTLNKLSGHKSGFQKEVEQELGLNNINFRSEVFNKFKAYNRFFKKEYSPRVDILIEDAKIVIECNGDMWHANPDLYDENDIIYLYDGPTEAKYIWAKDDIRQEQIESFGYTVFIVWESEFRENKEHIIEHIKCLINKKNQTK